MSAGRSSWIGGSDQAKLRMDSYTVLGWSYLRLGRYEDALSAARQARNEIRYDIRIIEIEAESLFYLGRNTESLALFEEYVSLSPTGERIDLVYYYMGGNLPAPGRISPCRHRILSSSAPQPAGGPLVGPAGLCPRTAHRR